VILPDLPDLSVIIPVYNRGDVIRYALESVRRAAAGSAIELIVVDDGSEPPAADAIAQLGFRPDLIIRQPNQGLLMARLAGLAAAGGRYIQFLDSDDLVSSEKLSSQIAIMDRAGADVSYTGTARTVLRGDYDQLRILPETPPAATEDAVEFYLRVQPAPHCPVFRADYLRRIVKQPLFPPSPRYNPVAEIWFYHNAAIVPTRVVPVPGPHAILGTHDGTRLTGHWEKLGLASLEVMEAFMQACPAILETAAARTAVGEAAFNSWRRLPRGFHSEFGERLLALWRRAPKGAMRRLGGAKFATFAHLVGPVRAAQWLRTLRNPAYDRVRTLPDATFEAWLRDRTLRL
jgi:hypothetical protein